MKKQNKQLNLLLPTGYLSYSAMQCWLKNRDRYIREYFLGEDKLDTKFLRFGKKVAQEREGRFLSPGQYTEYKIQVDICGVPCLSYIDFYDSNINEFQDDKSSKNPWTQSKVQKLDQLPFYATALKWKHGVIPKVCHIIWHETTEGCADDSDFWRQCENKLELTGKVVKFTREIDPREVTRIEKLIVKSATEISVAYKEFINSI